MSKSVEQIVAEKKSEGWGRVAVVTRAQRHLDMQANRFRSPVQVRALAASYTLCVVPASEDEPTLYHAVLGI